MEELNPCRCGKKPEYFIRPYDDRIEYIYVCPICKHFGVGFSDKEAIDDWNKRS